MADTVKMEHHAIAIPPLTPADRILEVARQVDRAIKQLLKECPIDKLAAVELLRKVLLGENKDPLPMNSVQKQRERERAQPVPHNTVEQSPATSVTPVVSLPTLAPVTTPSAKHRADPNYMSNNEEEEEDWSAPSPAPVPGQGLRQSKRVIEQLKRNEKEGLERIAALAVSESAVVPDLPIAQSKYNRGFVAANHHLQMDMWAFGVYFAGAIVDEITGRSLEYRDLIKDPKHATTWQTPLANELGMLSQGIKDILCKRPQGVSHFRDHVSPMICNMSPFFSTSPALILDSLTFFFL